ncbi:MAG: toxin-antitoxin system YwqK family antitoxin [Deltaproteobacteria bacterium]|nr:toxin-antitoxin system YwqK family antitoxin [Deltaproteobacteria bacterium]
MELARVIPASPFSAGTGLPGRELTPAEERAFARRRRAARIALVALMVAVPFAIGVIVVTATEPRVDLRVKRYNSGGIEQMAEWVGPVKHGAFTEFFTNGQKRAEGVYFENEKHGSVTTWFWNGALESRAGFDHGVRHGRHERFWPGGQPRSVEDYEHGTATGHWQTWSEAGILESEVRFQGAPGTFVERTFHETGRLRQETPFVDGLAEGLVTASWDNGQRMSEGRLDDGLREGAWFSWDEAGTLVEQSRWVQGEQVE